MTKVRIRFSRGEELKFISHLDLLKVFERALRRAGIPIAYSEGFNPHPKMTFALPLPVGVTSEAEYGDFEIDGDISPAGFRDEINANLPEALRVIDAAVTEGKQSLMSLVRSSSYIVDIEAGCDEARRIVAQFLEESCINVTRENRHGRREINIKPMILKLEVVENENKSTNCSLNMALSAGSEENLKPDVVVRALEEHSGEKLACKRIHRTGLYIDADAKKSPMMQ